MNLKNMEIKMNKRDELANSEEVIRDTYIDSAFTAKNAFKKGWESALANAPEVLALVEALKKISETKGLKYTSIRSFPREELIGTIEYDTVIAIEALAAFDARGK